MSHFAPKPNSTNHAHNPERRKLSISRAKKAPETPRDEDDHDKKINMLVVGECGSPINSQ
jgi:hypothetical protein